MTAPQTPTISTTSTDRHIFCLTDLWAAEAYLTALDAGEAELLSMLNKGIKIHNWMWEETKKVFPAQLPDSPDSGEGYNYKGAKQTVHALNYNINPPKMAQESGLPLPICEWQYQMYHSKFPGIKLRMARIERTLKMKRYSESLLGRRKYWHIAVNQHILNKAYAWPSQSFIGEVTNIVLGKIYWWGQHHAPWMIPRINTHDGIATDCLERDRAEVREAVARCYNFPVTKNGITIRIPVEMCWGYNFNEAFDKEIIRF